MLIELRSSDKVIGVKQSRRAIRRVFLAADADPDLVAPLREQCRQRAVPVFTQYTMRELGQAAGIQVDAAVVALL